MTVFSPSFPPFSSTRISRLPEPFAHARSSPLPVESVCIPNDPGNQSAAAAAPPVDRNSRRFMFSPLCAAARVVFISTCRGANQHKRMFRPDDRSRAFTVTEKRDGKRMATAYKDRGRLLQYAGVADAAHRASYGRHDDAGRDRVVRLGSAGGAGGTNVCSLLNARFERGGCAHSGRSRMANGASLSIDCA